MGVALCYPLKHYQHIGGRAMGCPLEVEVGDTIYEIEFEEFQVEVTGKCNMRCKHCRGSEEALTDMPLEQIKDIAQFAKNHAVEDLQVIISGGEPFLHKDFKEILNLIKDMGISRMSITTNGSLVREEYLNLFQELAFDKLSVCVSLDSIVASEHDMFRDTIGAFDLAINTIQMVSGAKIPGVEVSMRNTVLPGKIDQMKSVAEFAYNLGADRLNFAAVIPTGAAKTNPDLWMLPLEKKLFLEEVFHIEEQWRGKLQIMTSDPLKCIVRDEVSDGSVNNHLILDGCVAGTITFNVGSNGVLTPCPYVNVPIMDTTNKTAEEMARLYVESPVVKSLASLDLHGKCAFCKLKEKCSGCRGRALGVSGDYLGEDPDCWL